MVNRQATVQRATDHCASPSGTGRPVPKQDSDFLYVYVVRRSDSIRLPYVRAAKQSRNGWTGAAPTNQKGQFYSVSNKEKAKVALLNNLLVDYKVPSGNYGVYISMR